MVFFGIQSDSFIPQKIISSCFVSHVVSHQRPNFRDVKIIWKFSVEWPCSDHWLIIFTLAILLAKFPWLELYPPAVGTIRKVRAAQASRKIFSWTGIVPVV